VVAKNILEEFFDRKELSLLKVFLFDPAEKFYLREAAKKAKVPVATAFRIMARLKAVGVIEESRMKKTKLYSLAINKNTRFLAELFEEKRTIVDEFIDFVSLLDGVIMVVGHGDDQKDKANIIVVGNGVDMKSVKEKVGEIKEKYNFSIIELVLNPEQFYQMSVTGLIPAKKIVLWERPTVKPKIA